MRTVGMTAAALWLMGLAPIADSQAQAPLFLTGNVDWPGRPGPRTITAGDEIGDIVTLRGNIPHARIGPAAVRTPYRVASVSSSATVGDLEVTGLQAIVTDACVRAHAEQVVVRNMRCTMVGGPQSGGVNMPFGLDITAAKSVTVEDSSFDGFQWQAAADRYWNGDGITMEQDVRQATFRRVSSNNNSDAGFDVRPFAIMSDVAAEGNCRNFRFWSGGEVATLTTGDTIKRGGISACSGIWLNGSTERQRHVLHIGQLVVRMRRPGMIIEVETGPADIRIDSCDIQAPAGTTFVRFEKGAGTVKLGPGCRLGRS